MITKADPEFVVDFVFRDTYHRGRWEVAAYKGIPIKYRHCDVIENFLYRGKFRIRYRGPRRPGPTGQSSCLKKDATHFSIYRS